MTERTLSDFDHPDYLNSDGTVTLDITPSDWCEFSIFPNLEWDSLEDRFIDYANELDPEDFREFYGVDRPEGGVELDDFDFQTDLDRWVEPVAEELTTYIYERLNEAINDHHPGEYDSNGMWTHTADAEVDFVIADAWPYRESFRIRVRIDAALLRDMTEGFDAKDHAHDHYGADVRNMFSYSYNEDAIAQFDGSSRIEHVLAMQCAPDPGQWVERAYYAACDTWDEFTTITINAEAVRERALYRDTNYTLREIEEWADQIERETTKNNTPLFERDELEVSVNA